MCYSLGLVGIIVGTTITFTICIFLVSVGIPICIFILAARASRSASRAAYVTTNTGGVVTTVVSKETGYNEYTDPPPTSTQQPLTSYQPPQYSQEAQQPPAPYPSQPQQPPAPYPSQFQQPPVPYPNQPPAPYSNFAQEPPPYPQQPPPAYLAQGGQAPYPPQGGTYPPYP